MLAFFQTYVVDYGVHFWLKYVQSSVWNNALPKRKADISSEKRYKLIQEKPKHWNSRPITTRLLKKPAIVFYDMVPIFEDESLALALCLGVRRNDRWADYICNMGCLERRELIMQGFEEDISRFLSVRRGHRTYKTTYTEQGTSDHFLNYYDQRLAKYEEFLTLPKDSGSVKELEKVWITCNYVPDGLLPADVIVMDVSVKTPRQWLDWWNERHTYETKPFRCLVM